MQQSTLVSMFRDVAKKTFVSSARGWDEGSSSWPEVTVVLSLFSNTTAIVDRLSVDQAGILCSP